MTPLTERGKQIRRGTLKAGLDEGISDYGNSFSLVEILTALYDFTIDPESDIIIIPKKHAWIPCKALRHKSRIESAEELQVVSCDGLRYFDLRDPADIMPLGVAEMHARKMTGRPGHLYVIVGNEDVRKGLFWETLLAGKRLGLDNLTVIVNWNEEIDTDRPERKLHPTQLRQVAMHAGWAVSQEDGHHVGHLCDTFQWVQSISTPSLIIAETVKGRGVSFMEGDSGEFAKPLTPEQVEQAYQELT